MRHLVEEAESDALRKSGSKSNSSAVHLCLLDNKNELGTKRGLDLWAGFLYRQPTSVHPSDWPMDHHGLKEFYALTEVRNIAWKYDHLDAKDASLDALRDLFYHGIVVCGEHIQGDRYTELVNACIGPPEKPGDPILQWKSDVSKEQRLLASQDLLNLTNELLKVSIQKGEDERAGVLAPDLMARCRYHLHAAKGLPCYLDK
jgi:hypothetical protein